MGLHVRLRPVGGDDLGCSGNMVGFVGMGIGRVWVVWTTSFWGADLVSLGVRIRIMLRSRIGQETTIIGDRESWIGEKN